MDFQESGTHPCVKRRLAILVSPLFSGLVRESVEQAPLGQPGEYNSGMSAFPGFPFLRLLHSLRSTILFHRDPKAIQCP